MTGRRIFVAGSTGQIGRVIAREFARHGYLVALQCHRRTEAAQSLAASLPSASSHVVVSVDLSDPDAVDEAFACLAEEWGPVDDAVNAAWPATPSLAIAEADDAALEASLRGYRGHAHLCRAVLPSMRRSRGSLVFIGGALSTRLHPRLGLFGAAKAAATALTHVVALEEGSYGVRANVISPGRVATGDDLVDSDGEFAALDRIGELRRVLSLPTAHDIAAAARWLVAEESGAVTGQTITLAGGERV